MFCRDRWHQKSQPNDLSGIVRQNLFCGRRSWYRLCASSGSSIAESAGQVWAVGTDGNCRTCGTRVTTRTTGSAGRRELHPIQGRTQHPTRKFCHLGFLGGPRTGHVQPVHLVLLNECQHALRGFVDRLLIPAR